MMHDDDEATESGLHDTTTTKGNVCTKQAIYRFQGLRAVSAAWYGAATVVRTWRDFPTELAAMVAQNPPQPTEKDTTKANPQ